jgi:hypothetical protein
MACSPFLSLDLSQWKENASRALRAEELTVRTAFRRISKYGDARGRVGRACWASRARAASASKSSATVGEVDE